MERALQINRWNPKTAAFWEGAAFLGEDESGRHSRQGGKDMVELLFVLASLGILIVEVVEVLDKCSQLPAGAGQEMVPDTDFGATR
jgi:hypothetical protein